MAKKNSSNKKSSSNRQPIDLNKASLLSNENFDETECADYVEISTNLNNHSSSDRLIDKKCERFRRIASAEEIEELSNEISDFDFPEKQSEEELRKELAKTEEEIQTLRTVLTAKIKHSNELKRKLGITVWKEFRDEVENSFRNIQETSAYQKTSDAVKMSQQSVIGTLGSVARKLGEVKNTNAFKSFEEKVGYAVTNVKQDCITK
ncbi:hypothetical protein SSS_02747 [Sarcoptes scabiei]|nr:hypothetical protein SSS_02747 [Sarcoptes scabiei]